MTAPKDALVARLNEVIERVNPAESKSVPAHLRTYADLTAELRSIRDEIAASAPEQAVDGSYNSGIEAAAAWIDKVRDEFCEEYGHIEPDTNALTFGRGRHAEAREEYVGDLEELAEGIRALKSSTTHRPADAADSNCWTCGNAKHEGGCVDPKWGTAAMCDKLLARALKAESQSDHQAEATQSTLAANAADSKGVGESEAESERRILRTIDDAYAREIGAIDTQQHGGDAVGCIWPDCGHDTNQVYATCCDGKFYPTQAKP